MQPSQYLNLLRTRRRHALQVRSVSRIYPGGTRALDDISLSMDGGLCGVVGPTGAGKSTLLRILALDDRPDRGSVHLGDLDAATQAPRLRQLVRAVPNTLGLPPDLTIAQAVGDPGRTTPWGMPASSVLQVETQLRQVGLWDARGLRVDALPPAMRWRLVLAQGMIGSPRVLLLDDPLTHVAPGEARERLTLLHDLAQSRIVVVSASDVEPFRDLSMQLVILERGRVLKDGAVDRLVDDLRGRIWRGEISPDAVPVIAAQHRLLDQVVHAHAVQIEVCADDAPMAEFRPVEPDVSHVYREALAKPAH